MNPVMFEATEKMLDSRSTRKTILLAITPDSLRDAELINDLYYYPYKNANPLDLFLHRMNAPELFIPTTPKALYHAMMRRDDTNTTDPGRSGIWVWHNDTGWLENVFLKEEPFVISREGYINKYSAFVKDLQVSESVIAHLYEQISQWRQKGIRVFGHRSPMPKALETIANEDSGFDEKRFVEGFRQAGGAWIAVDSSHYVTRDGFHLWSEDAKKLSRYLARHIRNHRDGSSPEPP
ncbi:MAG: hypothetical protein HQM00_10255 [Magnetococcales bacterium]|nr:hypothetical protein [Magnetococcales bacterium]